jgi:hypothetical protein
MRPSGLVKEAVQLDRGERPAQACRTATTWVRRPDGMCRLVSVGSRSNPDREIETGQRTAGSPAIAPLGSEVILAWTGSDSHLNVATSLGLGFGEPNRLGYTSRVSPALSTSESTVALAWTGTDLHLNLAVGQAADGPFSSEWRLDDNLPRGSSAVRHGSSDFHRLGRCRRSSQCRSR